MAINFDSIRYINRGEPFDQTVLNRPTQDLALLLKDAFENDYLDRTAIVELVEDEAMIMAIIFG